VLHDGRVPDQEATSLTARRPALHFEHRERRLGDPTEEAREHSGGEMTAGLREAARRIRLAPIL
jgi:hypothetical protein